MKCPKCGLDTLKEVRWFDGVDARAAQYCINCGFKTGSFKHKTSVQSSDTKANQDE